MTTRDATCVNAAPTFALIYVENAGSSGGETHWTLGKAKAPESSQKTTIVDSLPHPEPPNSFCPLASSLIAVIFDTQDALPLFFFLSPSLMFATFGGFPGNRGKASPCVFPHFVSEKSRRDLPIWTWGTETCRRSRHQARNLLYF